MDDDLDRDKDDEDDEFVKEALGDGDRKKGEEGGHILFFVSTWTTRAYLSERGQHWWR